MKLPYARVAKKSQQKSEENKWEKFVFSSR